jgi:hypothetical protein
MGGKARQFAGEGHQHGALTPQRPGAKDEARQHPAPKAQKKPRRLARGSRFPRCRHAGMGEQDWHGKGWGTKISFHGASWNPEPILTAFRYEAVKGRAAWRNCG